MPLLPRLRRAKAELTIKAEYEAPPDERSGGVVRISVLLQPWESFTIHRGWLDLTVITTHFSRTVLDGYLEHSTEKLFRTVELCGQSEVRPGGELEWSADLPLSFHSPREGRPTRLLWKVQARFDVEGHREIRAANFLSPLGPASDQGPIVDGTGFLPLYEFRPTGDQ